MSVKIAGIVVLGLVLLGLPIYLGWRYDQKVKQEEAARKQRFEEKKQNDAFTLSLFGMILQDQEETVTELREALKGRDDKIAELENKITKMNKNAAKLNLKEALNK